MADNPTAAVAFGVSGSGHLLVGKTAAAHFFARRQDSSISKKLGARKCDAVPILDRLHR